MAEDKKVVSITPQLQPVKPTAGHTVVNERGSFDSDRFEQMWTVAERMANMSVVPLSLRSRHGNDGPVSLELGQIVANCAKVVNQAADWNMNPYAVLDCASIVTDQDGESHVVYEGKVIMAALEGKGVLLDYEVLGDGDEMRITATGKRSDGKEESIRGSVQKWQTKRWKPELFHQMLIYRAAREWARLYKPAVMLGIYAPDEFDRAPAPAAKPRPPEPKSMPPRRSTAVLRTDVAAAVPARELSSADAPVEAATIPSGNIVSVEKPKAVRGKKLKPADDGFEEKIWLDGFKKELSEISSNAHLERTIQRREKAMKHLSPEGLITANTWINEALKEHPT